MGMERGIISDEQTNQDSTQTPWRFSGQIQRDDRRPSVHALPSQARQGTQSLEVNEPFFPSGEEAIDLNKRAIGQYHQLFGDSPEWGGVLKPNELESALASARQHYYYGEEPDDAKRYAEAVAKMGWRVAGSQVFANGNKRTAYGLMQHALDQNGLSHLSPIEGTGDPELVDHLIAQDSYAGDPSDRQRLEDEYLNMWRQRYDRGGPLSGYQQRYPEGTYIVDPQSMRQSNILDPIHAELDSRVWNHPAADKPTLKPVHAHWIKKHVYDTLEHAGYTDIEKWLTLVLTGSLTTYQYSDSSDVDVSLFVDSRIFPEWSRAEMIALMVDRLDGTVLPGTPFPLQDFVVSEGIKPNDLYKPGLRSGYNIDTNKWIVPPERSRIHDVKVEEANAYTRALLMADKMERLLIHEPDAAIRFWHSIHRKRQADMRAGKGDYADSNVTYKMLSQRGLFPQIADVSGEYIAKAAATKPPHLRESEGQKACWNCWAYDNGHCEMFGGYKVREDQVCDDWEKTKPTKKTSANNLLYNRDQHPEGKGFILDDGSVWTWPTENLKPMHMQYNHKAKQQGYQVMPGSAFHIKEGKVWQYGPGRSLTPEQQQAIYTADPKLEPAPTKRQEELDATPGFGHGQNVLNILERESSWVFVAAVNIPEIARRIYEKGVEGVGATINLHGETPRTRYGFAPDKTTETPIPPQQFTPQVVEDFIAKWAARLRDPEKFVGSWVRDDGMIILDISEGHDDYHEANRRAFAGQQEALWDNLKHEPVSVVDPATLMNPPSAM